MSTEEAQAKAMMAEQMFIDVSVDSLTHLYVLGNGAVTHNCMIGMGYHYRARVEWICFLGKGKRRLNDLSVPDLLEFPEVEGAEDWWRPSGPDIIKARRIKSRLAYPTEKPVELIEVLVRQSSQPGELIIDPFMGSGSTGEAALKHGCRFEGTDTSEFALKWTTNRLSQLAGLTVGGEGDEDESFSIDEVF